MSKAEFYSFSKKKLVIMGIAIFVCQVSLFGAGYLLSTVLRPEPNLTAANGQPCSLPGASASGQSTPATPQTAPAASAPATAQVAVAHEEQKVNAEVASATGAPAREIAAAERGVQKQVAAELAVPAGAAQQPSAAANKPAGAPAGASAAEVPGTAETAAAARPANPRVAAVACEAAPDLVSTAATPAEAHKYAVQIGAFLDANNALRLASEFKAKGYQPCLMKAADKQGRRWTVVRMGAFEDVGKASLYARSISGREQTVALVRPADSF